MNREIIPAERWGRDHFTTLMYIETCVVDQGGIIRGEKMRSRDPGYPTRLRDSQENNHGDWDCVEDMREAGLLEGGERNTFEAYYVGEGPNPKKEPIKAFRLTDKGWKLVHALRRWKGEGNTLLIPLDKVLAAIE